MDEQTRKVIAGLDASRRVGWAKYYSECPQPTGFARRKELSVGGGDITIEFEDDPDSFVIVSRGETYVYVEIQHDSVDVLVGGRTPGGRVGFSRMHHCDQGPYVDLDEDAGTMVVTPNGAQLIEQWHEGNGRTLRRVHPSPTNAMNYRAHTVATSESFT